MNVSIILSLLASMLTATQSILIVLQGDGICLNEGCRIVDSLTTVPPLVFNFVGFLYFQAIFWGLLLDRKIPGLPLNIVKALGLSGIASEGVLVAFQYYISEAFCLYCLVVCTFIVLLNISLGRKQTAVAAMIFTAVILAFSSLQFKPAGNLESLSLEKGMYGVRSGNTSGPELSFFFSSACPHCENVIETLKETKSCSIRFQPIEKIPVLDFPGIELSQSYSSVENHNFLRALGIIEIPVVMAKDRNGIRILKGEEQITTYLNQNCGVEPPPLNTSQSQSDSGESSTLQQSAQDDACSILSDCEAPPTSNQSELSPSGLIIK